MHWQSAVSVSQSLLGYVVLTLEGWLFTGWCVEEREREERKEEREGEGEIHKAEAHNT